MPSKKIIIISISILLLFFLFFVSIIYPSHVSVVSSCNSEKFEKEYPNYHVTGSFSVEYSNKTNESIPIITLNQGIKEDSPTMKHELIHQWEFEHGVLFNCRFPILKLFSEIPAYSVQRYYEFKELIF
ncbi:MAG: hypothetical protein KKB88_05300 [Nanoarchaeota archaeon]|nr:hypothetical protein [Nanoarchaeota archaeon]